MCNMSGMFWPSCVIISGMLNVQNVFLPRSLWSIWGTLSVRARLLLTLLKLMRFTHGLHPPVWKMSSSFWVWQTIITSLLMVLPRLLPLWLPCWALKLLFHGERSSRLLLKLWSTTCVTHLCWRCLIGPSPLCCKQMLVTTQLGVCCCRNILMGYTLCVIIPTNICLLSAITLQVIKNCWLFSHVAWNLAPILTSTCALCTLITNPLLICEPSLSFRSARQDG